MYTPLEDKSDHESQSSSEDTEGLLTSKPQTRFSSHNTTFKYILFVLIPLTGLISLGLGIWIGSSFGAIADRICPEHVQKYSPILSEVDTSIHVVRFNGSLMKENVFRQVASPEVDAAWESLGVNCKPLSIVRSREIRLIIIQIEVFPSLSAMVQSPDSSMTKSRSTRNTEEASQQMLKACTTFTASTSFDNPSSTTSIIIDRWAKVLS